MTTHPFNLKNVHPSWLPCIEQGLSTMDKQYLTELTDSKTWLPGPDAIFNAFSLPITQVHYVLFGESPYPRAISANGYAFWDAAVNQLWSDSGMSKQVNRATSLRNLIKMLLVAENVLEGEPTQERIAALNKESFVQTNQEFFKNFLQQGFLLLNASPVLQAHTPQKDAKAWTPFVHEVLKYLLQERPHVQFILLGRIANTINKLLPQNHIKKLYAEHPYNHSFIHNQQVLDFFRPMHLLLNHKA